MKKNAQLLNTPLIYIEQPAFTPTNFNKQIVVVKAMPKKAQMKDIQEEIPEEKEQIEPSEELDGQEAHDDSNNVIENGMHKQGFLNRTIEDKLNILTKLPESMPQPLCEVTTKESTYTCTVQSYTEDEVYIELPDNKETIQLEKNAILSITIIRL
ncbi:CotO family spore coat protein [Pueribacillus sp. YX66]|uniref:CotO family spore coat protein n=1 Tax=Pueribacillus sp. YX66 TaxID=3229242 RepID=UPI00358D5BEB